MINVNIYMQIDLYLGILTKPQKIISRYTKLYETVSDFMEIPHLFRMQYAFIASFGGKKFRIRYFV